MRRNRIKKLLNDRGSALLTVIIAVMFLTLLATTLLYITGMNFMIKQADYQNKKNFYSGETALESIKANLMEDIVSEAAEEAYMRACTTYVTAASGDIREIQYNMYFVEAAKKKLHDEMGSDDWVTYLSSLYTTPAETTITLTMDDSVQHVDATTGLLINNPSPSTNPNYNVVIDEVGGMITIQNIHVLYINNRSLATKISTNLEIHAPKIDWSVDKSATELTVTPQPGESYVHAQAAAQSSAVEKKIVDVSRCVKYTNWVKE